MAVRFSSQDELAPIGHALKFFRDHCEYHEEEVHEHQGETIVCFFAVKVKHAFLNFKKGMEFADVQYLSKRKIFHINSDHRKKNVKAMQMFWDGGKIDETFNKESVAQIWCSGCKFDKADPHYNYEMVYVASRREMFGA